MGFDYSSIAATADAMIETYGADVAVRRLGRLDGSGVDTERAPSTFTRIVAVSDNMKRWDRENLVLLRSQVLYIRVAEGFVPEVDDKFMMTGATQFLANPQEKDFVAEATAVVVEKIAPGGSNVLFIVEVRS